MSENGRLPRARQDGLLEETVGAELLLYDQDSHAAHCLSPIAACVWRHCDGEHDLTDLAVLAGAGEDLVADALHELREKDLLVAEPQLMHSTVPGESRREAIGRTARYSAAAAAGSMIVSATAATPAMAASSEHPLCEKVAGTCCECDNGLCFKETENEAACKAQCKKKEHNFVSWTNQWNAKENCLKPE
jgi:hypothetical protein